MSKKQAQWITLIFALCIVPFWDGPEPKRFQFEKGFGVKRVFGLKKFWVKKVLGLKSFGFEKMLGKIVLGLKSFGFQKSFGLKEFSV